MTRGLNIMDTQKTNKNEIERTASDTSGSENKRKKRRGDRKDAYLVRDLDSMHYIVPYNIPGRTANEAVMNETVDLTEIKKYVDKKNAGGEEFKYTFFHVIAAAIAKTIVLRPKMNYFYSGNRLWEKKEVSLSFVVKKKLADDSRETLATIVCPREGIIPIEHIHSEVKKIVYHVRIEGKNNEVGDIMDIFFKMPRWMISLVFKILRSMEFHGKYPSVFMNGDPYYSSCFISNLGSIKMHAQYHHLAEWGTNSLFCIIGEKKPTPFFNYDGSFDVRDALELGLTVDERIADGVYFANSLKILRRLLSNPELLELPIETPVEVD